jgi:hypothetical protein
LKTDELTEALKQCSLHSLLMLTSKALTRSGFGDVEILDRRRARQKSRFGGHELSCLAHLGPVPVKVLVKVVRDDVRTRMLDELAGCVLRNGADIGMIVSAYNVSGSVEVRQANYRPVRVEILDGNGLANLMRCSGIAVRPSGDVDYAFLSELEAVSDRLLDFIRKEKP